MWIKKAILAATISSSILAWWKTMISSAQERHDTSNIWVEQIDSLKHDNINQIQEDSKEKIYLCLDTDDKESFTHTKALETVTDPENTILEYPVSQIFQKYWNKSHPLYVSWIAKNFRALLWSKWIDSAISSIPQKLVERKDSISLTTRYQVWDTLRFSLIDQQLIWEFPDNLEDQLNEKWFQTFSDPDSLTIANKNNLLDIDNNEANDTQPDYTYDIVVKKLSTWEYWLAVYRDWKLFLASFASVWLKSKKTITWQYDVIWKNAYKRSKKYEDSPMSFWLWFDTWWYWIHQWNVTWKPASHGCVRLPWVYASVVYSLINSKKHTDIFIDKNLYN